MGLLSTSELNRRMSPTSEKELAESLIITPLLSSNQVSESSVDLRLGSHFTLTRTTRVQVLDATRAAGENTRTTHGDARQQFEAYQRQVVVPCGSSLVLHPGDFVLGTTLEYLRLPMDLSAYVMGRSSWGRLGLIIATAAVVHPGFAGCITLELANESAVPIVLRPGTRICQLTVHQVLGDPDEECSERYAGQVLSGYSRIYEDEELAILDRLPIGA